jgi:hypothetical protein
MIYYDAAMLRTIVAEEVAKALSGSARRALDESPSDLFRAEVNKLVKEAFASPSALEFMRKTIQTAFNHELRVRLSNTFSPLAG